MAALPPDVARRLQELETLYESLRAITSTLDLGDLVRKVLDSIKTITAADALSLLLHDAERGELVFAASETLSEEVLGGAVDVGVRLRLDQGIAGWVASHREPVCLDDVGSDPRHDPTLARKTGLFPRTMICVPLVHQDALLGVLQLINKRGSAAFTADEVRLVQTLATQAAGAIAQAQLYREVERASRTDDLTGLGNTRRFNSELPALLARGGELSLLVLDLDAFKAVVDRHGHLVGSRAIATVGRIIADCLRPGDSAARFGGDEFVVVLPDTTTAAATAVADTIRRAIADCAHPDGSDVDIRAVTASIGIATYPVHATTSEDLFRAADGAMYRVKSGGKNGIAVAAPRR